MASANLASRAQSIVGACLTATHAKAVPQAPAPSTETCWGTGDAEGVDNVGLGLLKLLSRHARWQN